ncbi:hypothetical protein VTN77DRAFT_2403 [Rasamsonia byssochlamydoides]|uniref:uncharacterized protein n=1 Tax=Rasamsonia byssochlamydoides TaxID=89139 RepID=UPI003743986B
MATAQGGGAVVPKMLRLRAAGCGPHAGSGLGQSVCHGDQLNSVLYGSSKEGGKSISLSYCNPYSVGRRYRGSKTRRPE